MKHCPALLISAPSSGQGKTTVTAALARYHRNQGRKVRVFKTGPDYLDPMILERASGQPVYQLDLWMTGEAECKHILYQAAAEADLILIEGVMGLFDGNPSSADLAETFGVPVMVMINASSMAQTFGALAQGLTHYRASLEVAGVLANQVASQNHADMLQESIPHDTRFFGSLMRNAEWQLPDRHLGLYQASEIEDLGQRLESAAAAIAKTQLAQLPAPVAFSDCVVNTTEPLLKGKRIGVARDEAFSFIYPANLDCLQQLGATLSFFSPLHDSTLPDVDCLWLPGGYPELHLQALQDNRAMHDSIHQHYADNKPILAECGGMLYLLESLTDQHGQQGAMLGIMPGKAVMQDKLAGLGMQEVSLGGGNIKAHTFHHSRMQTALTPVSHAIRRRGQQPGEAVYQLQALTASYLHLYFASDPAAIARLFSHD